MLTVVDPNKAFDEFINNKQFGQNQNMAKAINILMDKSAWAGHGIILDDMSLTEMNEFESMLGMNKLFTNLVGKQFHGTIEAIHSTLDFLRMFLHILVSFNPLSVEFSILLLEQCGTNIEHLLNENIDQVQTGKAAQNLNEFCIAFHGYYNTLASSRPYIGTSSMREGKPSSICHCDLVLFSEYAKKDKAKLSKLDHREAFQAAEAEGIGYTLPDIDEMIADWGMFIFRSVCSIS
jgi:hypothetical protein